MSIKLFLLSTFCDCSPIVSASDGSSPRRPSPHDSRVDIHNLGLSSVHCLARPKSVPLLARLRRACHLGKKADHTKLQALAQEIFNDWDAVVAFVHHPELPSTNNEAERALRHAVIARQIGYGTRTSEGSLAYSSRYECD
jgi:hypothetical protein